MAKPKTDTGIAFVDETVEPVAPATDTAVEIMPALINSEMEYEDYLQEAFNLGETKGAGDETQVSLALKILDGAVRKKISPLTIKEQKGAKEPKDHIDEMWKRFLAGRSGKLVHQRVDNDNKLSQLRAFARLGVNPDLDARACMDNIVAVYKAVPEAEKKSLKDAFNAYVDAVRLQNDKDHRKVALTDDAILDRVKKKPGTDPTVVSAWLQIEKLVTSLVTGTREKVEDKSNTAAAIALSVKTYTERLVAEAKAEATRVQLTEVSDEAWEAQEAAFEAARAARKAKAEAEAAATMEAAE